MGPDTDWIGEPLGPNDSLETGVRVYATFFSATNDHHDG